MIQRLVCLGSVIVDLELDAPRLPERGGDVLATQRGMRVGGALNVMSTAARLGLRCAYAGSHGTGPFGDLVREQLTAEGIEILTAPNPDLDTGYTVGLIEPDGERTFITVTGADGIVEPAALTGIEYQAGDAVYLSGYDLAYPGAGGAIAEHVARIDRTVFVALDPGPLAGEIPAQRLAPVLERAGLISLNERESAMLRLAGFRGVVVVREGARGATLREPGAEPVRIEAVPLTNVASTSGAGDYHVGATLAGLARGLSWPEAVRFANQAAADRLK